MKLIEQAALARTASRSIRSLCEESRNAVLADFADTLEEQCSSILAQNALDVQESRANGMSEAMLDRLQLNEKRILGIAEGVRQVAQLPDPLGIVLEERTIRSGIHLQKVTVPIGVIGIIFESRPNVTADCAALAFKAGNAVVLKGGKESYRSCAAIVSCMKNALRKNNISEDAVQLAEKPSHEETQEFMEDRNSVDLLIPRGGKKLIRAVVDHAKVPVIETGAGVCHTYVDDSADFAMAEQIILNAKCQRPSVCNAMETLLVNQKIAEEFLPRITASLKERGVTIYSDEQARSLVEGLQEATEESWYTEYNDLMLNLRIVPDTAAAIDHIEKYGTHHSECIVSETPEHVLQFMNSIDSACLYHNASTRFTDGFEFGLGAEIGISTQKLHARGPMGLRELTTYMYKLEGNGEIRK